MVTIKDGCGCGTASCCSWKDKLEEAYKRATASVNKIGDDAGSVYFPDGTGFVKVPLPTKEQINSLAQVDAIKASVDELNKTVPALETQLTGVTESLVSNVEVLNGTTAGKFKVRIDREKAALIDSNDYDLSKVNSVELIQGSGPAMVKAQLTLSDGTVLRSDDFLFTSESIGTDVYISSFTFKAGNVDGTISADIGLNNGTTLEANNFVVPTDPSVVSTITDLQTRMSAVESGSGVSGLDALKTTVDTHTSEIAQLTVDVGNLTTSKVNVAQGTENAGKALVVGVDGNVTVGNAGGAGEVWEEVDLNNWPTDWAAGDKIRICPNVLKGISVSAASWTSEITVNNSGTDSNIPTACVEFALVDDSSSGEYIYNLMETSGSGYARVQHFLSVEPYFSNFNNLNTKHPLAYMVYLWNGHSNSRLHFIQYTTLSVPKKIIKMYRQRA